MTACYRSQNTVHPRLCGEHEYEVKEGQSISGSSPPVRGTLLRGLLGSHDDRFIPACAGNTSRR